MKLTFAILLIFSVTQAFSEPSICYGTTSDGHLENGVQLPSKGKNYVGYSSIMRIAGRTYVHDQVEEIVVSAYKALETDQPGKIFKYGETGFQSGGEFKPHKTHRNGLSVDFFVPVVDDDGSSIHLQTNLFNKFGYSIELDKKGQLGSLHIDYEAMSAHIVQLHKQAISRGFDIWRVIFDPDMQKYLFETDYANYLHANITFSERPSWVRHDEHYHVDFTLPCVSER